MNTQQVQFSTFTLPERKGQSINWKRISGKYFYHWPLFIIGLTVSIAAAIIYLQLVKPVYEVKATLLIKDEKRTPDQQSALHEIDLSNSTKIIENEIEILKSKQLIGQVVKDLQLWTTYQKKDGLFSEELYKSGPVKFTLLKPIENFDKREINIIIKDENSFFLQTENGKLKEVAFKDRFQNNFGVWKLEPTSRLMQYKGTALKIKLVDPEKCALQYQKLINISLLNKLATAVSLSLNDRIPQRGKDILNHVILNYNLAATVEKDRETKRTLDFIDQRLASLTGELTAAEKGIEGFKSSRGLTDISSESKISLENMQANDSRLNEVNVQLTIIEGIERYIYSSKNSGKAPATLGILDPALSNLIEKLSQLQLQYDKLSATTPETNPDFDPINRQILTTREAIRDNVKNIKSSLLSTRAKLQSFNSHFESSIRNIPAQERQYISIKRQQAIKENLYTYLLQKREEVSVSYAATLADDRIVDQAYSGPERPIKPIAYAVAILFGIGLPAGLIYGRNNFNNRITDVQEIKNTVEIAVISELPFVSSTNLIAISDITSSAIGEQFRALRTRLYYLNAKNERGRVILLTSSVPGEGKSFVSSNLGIALAYTGRKTIILELDMRKPKIAITFNLPKEHAGISDFLKGNAAKAAIIQESGLSPNLDIISSGSIILNPSELLEKNQLKDLISDLRDVYDDIIIDSPPVHLVPDALILSRLTDITLYIIRQGFTENTELNFIKELHDQKQLPNINIVFNGIQKIKYGYGFDYGNGYYNTYQKSKRFNAVFGDFASRF